MIQSVLEVKAEGLAKESIVGHQRELNASEPLQRHFAKAFADRVADNERADQRRTADSGAEQHSEVPAPVKAQAAKDEGSEFQFFTEAGV